MTRAWETAGRAFSQERLPRPLLDEVERGVTGGIAAAPVHVVVGADTRRGLDAAAAESIYPAVQNLLLAADRTRARDRTHHHRARLRRRAAGARRDFRTTCGRWRWSRSDTRPGRRDPRGATRSPSTPTASSTGRRGPVRPTGRRIREPSGRPDSSAAPSASAAGSAARRRCRPWWRARSPRCGRSSRSRGRPRHTRRGRGSMPSSRPPRCVASPGYRHPRPGS